MTGLSMDISTALNEEIATAEQVSRLIRERRSVFADDYLPEPVPDRVLEEILINGTWAPTYKMTEPWRFIVLGDAERERYGGFMADYYRARLSEADFPAERYEQAKLYPQKAGALVAIIFRRNQKIEISEWEELAAVACAVQNMYLSCTAYGLGGYWDTCGAAQAYGEHLSLEDNERSLGFFYMGYYDRQLFKSKKRRTPLHKKLERLP
ncbi:nitroreductase [Roseivirga sp. BDSF3-8]|uniref:nitroreductase family protein n=1 Tax=Roseivirga sp. BDSF3-8 TaxID=3241598 RepID=UPI003531F1C6